MSWRGSALTALLIGLVYWGVRPYLIQRVGTQLYLGIVVGLVILIALLTAAWQARRRRYACGHCGHVFTASAGRHLLGQNWFGRLRTRCPSCEQASWCSPEAHG